MEWITWFFEHNSSSLCKVYVCMMWTIWSEHNKWVHEGQKRKGLDIVDSICPYIREFKVLQKVLHVREGSLLEPTGTPTCENKF